jgi:hypothetical protein
LNSLIHLSSCFGVERKCGPPRIEQARCLPEDGHAIFLFLGSQAGGDRAAVLYTVLQSAILNGLDPEAYLADIIDRLAKDHPVNRLSELLPWNWKPNCEIRVAA